jgi:hypothetical protein
MHRPTLATHLLSAAAASALIAGGLSAIMRLSPGVLGLVILVPVGLWISAVLAAIAEERLRTALIVVGLTAVPAYALVILQVLALERYPFLGWILLALAVAVLAQALFASALAMGPRTPRAAGR